MRKSTNKRPPSFKLWLVSPLLVTSIFGLPAMADTVQEELKRCTEFSDDSKRLACYDKLANNLQTHVEQRFGQEEKRAIQEAPESITATIESAQKGAYGKYTFTLDNGQVWRQTDSGRTIWRGGEQVTLERGALGSFFMRKTEGGRALRVKRIK
ncbi:hypothetical protein KUV22_04610 [Microbulbifer agarilyticus]|uniref:hypothetical protein n=1 Tax=Microbulbifer agarilyticus TaxID=260552 RepID=UPI001C981D36|nr:hypothetical protein [Microbulbifer agarilyticus]MBY6189693.1 hypothetical protein [Microbulbifer agarilyticus]